VTRIAVVGLACRFPDAASPGELWENVLAGRRAFRRLPDERVRLADYYSPNAATPDHFDTTMAAVIEGYQFDRVRFMVAGSTYRSTDLTHWLALDVADQALADAGFPGGEGLPRERTAAIVGNTLTGDTTRAHLMRLRWPYVRRVVADRLRAKGWGGGELAGFLAELEDAYKSPFPATNEDSLAGSLSNTIAGRVCNHFDLGGGGYTVDGACASSLLSVVTACTSLATGEVDVALAGGVDLSLDPFELVGFAKAGALATREMLVYDRGANGFWPGEGCGMVVLMREADARAQGRRVYATLAGWGVSSDGRGGITRPEASGYRLALRRAYRKAGFGPDTVPLFEGHGTGTAVGDAIELGALTAARRAADPDAPPAAVGSIKAMIGHTKAAAGVAGLIKATLAVHHQVIPPTVGCDEPHPELCGDRPALRVVRGAEPWPSGAAPRAGVTAMGFGGVNSHVVLDGPGTRRRGTLDRRTRTLASSLQDRELLLVDAATAAGLRARLAWLAGIVPRLSIAELTDLAVRLHREQQGRAYRAAVVARLPQQAADAIGHLIDTLDHDRTGVVNVARGAFAGEVTRPGRLGLLFPGQGAGRGLGGGALARRFAEAREAYAAADLPAGADASGTAVAQPRIVAGSLAGLGVLAALGIEATAAVGHSLGEITALHWAGAMTGSMLLKVAAARGAIMAQHSPAGAMAGIGAGPEQTTSLIGAEPVVIAGYNGPHQTVVAGEATAVDRVCRAAGAAGLVWRRLPVGHAFHSPLMAPAAEAFGAWLAGQRFDPIDGSVVSTVTGGELGATTDLREHLRRQVLAPVRFAPAVHQAAAQVDLLMEVGPGEILTRMARELVSPVPVVALDTDAQSIGSLLSAVAAAYVRGVPADLRALFEDRLVRPLDLDRPPAFFTSPCETAPAVPAELSEPAVPAGLATPAGGAGGPAARATEEGTATAQPPARTAIEVLRTLVAQRTELPVELIRDDSRLLDELHMSSITVGEVVNEAARALSAGAVVAPTAFATATLRELADAIAELAREGGDGPADPVAGVGAWVRAYSVARVPVPVPARVRDEPDGTWRVYADPGHRFAERLRAALSAAGVGAGVVICLPEECPESSLELALAGVRDAVRQPPGGRLVVWQRGRGAAGLARTARLEGSDLRTTVVDAPVTAAAVEKVVAEVAATETYLEAWYDEAGRRHVPMLRPLPVPGGRPLPLTAADVLLVTGGGKGITAECALMLATASGARLAVLGRSDPAADAELAANLARLRAAVPAVRYHQVDVTDDGAVRAVVAAVEREWGPVTAVLHGAAHNVPASLAAVDARGLRRTFAPKVGGLRAVLGAVDPSRLRLLVTFGSIIGRAGLRGEGEYAAANDWLAELTAEVARTHPTCRAVCVEWSVWSGVGMAERLSVVESLRRAGVTPIGTDEGVAVLRALLTAPQLPPVVVVAGRTGDLETLRYERRELPLLRFLERPLVHYDGVEMVTEAVLSAATDPYLADHELDGLLLFPAVLGMEAMAQVATALVRHQGVPVLRDVRFDRPIVVRPGGTTTIRVAALVTGEAAIEVAIRSDETGFAVDHFRATLCFSPDEAPRDGDVPAYAAKLDPVSVDPATELYGDTLFQGGRFRRLVRYRHLAARRAEAVVATGDAAEWFGAFLPRDLVLGDPGARDAFMHAIQVCVPDAVLLPLGVDQVSPAGPKLAATEQVTVTARERDFRDGTYVYDVCVRDGSGTLIEHWAGLRLRAVRRRAEGDPWVPALLGPYLQRRLAGMWGRDIGVAVSPESGPSNRDAAGSTGGTPALFAQALCRPVTVRYRPDGRPQVDGDRTVSAAHSPRASVAVAGDGVLACDIEPVTARPEAVWRDLLGAHAALADLIVGETGEDHDLAATRVWCAAECVQKAGRHGGPMTLRGGAGPGWVLLDAGGLHVATVALTLRGDDRPTVLAVLSEGRV
jgi:enediyne polyketide synthase